MKSEYFYIFWGRKLLQNIHQNALNSTIKKKISGEHAPEPPSKRVALKYPTFPKNIFSIENLIFFLFLAFIGKSLMQNSLYEHTTLSTSVWFLPTR